MTESLTNSKGKSSHHHIRNPETKKRHSELDIPALDIVDKDLDIEGQFKQYLQYIENIERKFQN